MFLTVHFRYKETNVVRVFGIRGMGLIHAYKTLLALRYRPLLTVYCAYLACSLCVGCYVEENHTYASVDRIIAQRVS